MIDNFTKEEFFNLVKKSPVFSKYNSIVIIIKNDDTEDDIYFLKYLLSDYFSMTNVPFIFKINNYIRISNRIESLTFSDIKDLNENNITGYFNTNLIIGICNCKNNELYNLLKTGKLTPTYFPKILINN